ncbi:hypothetical protein QQS21_009695 [Conoideocrella luteorostrata]|uniref:Rhodopsin domain-containing protein n=1 Tax=Conoideocrella luteorostrata TaxID=1105319 RepID=A0AAJ0FVE0_9HYPO|nr:hypothetical protein QQS21_009695 [Conoideocrella luteorostrata]
MAQEDKANVAGVPSYSPKKMRDWALVIASVMSFLAGLSIVLRYFSRRIRKQPLWWDDYMIAFSMLWNWIVVAIALVMYAYGAGYHAETIGPEAVANISHLLLVAEVIYIWHMCWTKLSVLLMYYRVFHVPAFKRLVIGVGSFVVAWAIAGTFLFTFICVPTQKLWYPDIPGHCVSEMGVWVANASSTIFSDIAILVLPIPQIWKLNTKTSEKIGLTVVFGLGFFTVFTSSYRVWVLFNYSKSDVSYTLFPLLVWTDIEMCAAVISANLPTLRPFLRTAASKLGITRSSDRRHHPSTDPSSSSGGKNTTGSRSTDRRSVPRRAGSHHLQPADNTFYRLPELEHSDMDINGILTERIEYIFEPRCRSKESWYTSTTPNGDTDRENSLTADAVELQPVYHINSWK